MLWSAQWLEIIEQLTVLRIGGECEMLLSEEVTGEKYNRNKILFLHKQQQQHLINIDPTNNFLQIDVISHCCV